jgi:hypothetical protein
MIGKTMTPSRHRRKLELVIRGLFAAALVVAGAAGIGGAGSARAQTGEQVVVDVHSGLAISGFDPVAYFTEGAATLGKGDFEYRYAGAVWRFRNQGNRAAFMADPQVYLPRFGGYDPVSLARGVAVPGHPKLWFVSAGRLYLFHSVESQAAFVLDADRTASAAERKWPSVLQTLSP